MALTEWVYSKIFPENNLHNTVVYQTFQSLPLNQRKMIGTSMLIGRYCIYRLLSYYRVYLGTAWTYRAINDYYGTEIEVVLLNPKLAEILDWHFYMLRGRSDAARIEYTLLTEYGRLLPTIANKKWYIGEVDYTELEFSNPIHLEKCLNSFFTRIVRDHILPKDEVTTQPNTRVPLDGVPADITSTVTAAATTELSKPSVTTLDPVELSLGVVYTPETEDTVIKLTTIPSQNNTVQSEQSAQSAQSSQSSQSSPSLEGDLLCFIADSYSAGNNVLSRLRNEIGERCGLRDRRKMVFCWVLDFPLFDWDEETKSWSPTHHPFTGPKAEHLEFLESDPGKVFADCYDIVCNGTEMASGSIRIHRPDIQARVFSLLNIDEATQKDRFGHMLEAFQFGAPPHGGIAPGIDRIVMHLLDEDNIREVMAFPKIGPGLDPMMGAPSEVDESQWVEMGLQLRPKK